MFLLNSQCCADNSLCLHNSNLRIGYGQTASTMSHHRVELFQALDDRLDVLYGFALGVSQFLDIFFCLRNELMQRRIQETDGYRVAFHSFE